ncbi:MAG: Lar family restriction alleviation protein [Pseudomonadota bacterium]
MKDEKLKPCPFCLSEEVEIERISDRSCVVQCVKCGGSTADFRYKEEAITAWNMRADDGAASNVDWAIKWLETAADYFEIRPTDGEDMAHWANVYNAENARKIATLLSTRADGWQPIESTNPPKDGTRVLVYVPPYGAMTAHNDFWLFGGSKKDVWHCHACLNKEAQPTHWRPLDAPPTPIQESDDGSAIKATRS